jgi:hypothetical protein
LVMGEIDSACDVFVVFAVRARVYTVILGAREKQSI